MVLVAERLLSASEENAKNPYPAFAGGLVRRVLGLLLVGGALLVAPVSASASISSVNVTVTPSTKVAGAHPNVAVDEVFTYSDSTDSVKSTTLHFPPGLIGNPLATPLCSQADFQADTCPADTQVGTTTVTATVG